MARLYVVSARSTFISIIREVFRKLPENLPVNPVIKVAGSSDDLASSERPQGDLNYEFVVLDLASPGEIDRFVHFARSWHYRRPWSQLICVAPWDDRRPQDWIIPEVIELNSWDRVPCHLIVGYKILNEEERWEAILRRPVRMDLGRRIINEVAAELRKNGRDAAARKSVFALMFNAPVTQP